MVDPLVARDLPGWTSRVVGLFRSQFRSLAMLAVLPAVVTVGYLLALNWVRQSPDQLRARMAEMAAANGGVLPPDAAAQIMLGRLLPVLLISGLLILLAGLLFQGTGWYSVLRRANHEFAPVADGARFALSRVPALAGWSLAGGVLVTAAVALPLLPAVLSDSGPVVLAGALVAVLVGLTVGSGVFSVLPGVVLVERGGLGQAVALLRGRWLATGMRMLIASLVYIVYGLVTGLLVSGVAALTGPGLISSLVQGLTVIPVMVFQLVVAVVTYAELRGRADGTTTGGLAAELVGRPRPTGSIAPGSFESGSAESRPRRRWRGLRWVTPVLVLAMLAAGAPSWSGSTTSPSVVPVAAVSPVPAAPEDGTGGGESDNSAGTEAKASGSSDVSSGNDGNNSSGDSVPEVANTPDKPDSGGGESGEQADPAVTTPDTPKDDPGATGSATGNTDPKPDQPRADLANQNPGTGEPGTSGEQGTETVAPNTPPGDPNAPPTQATGPTPPPDPNADPNAVADPNAALPGQPPGAEQGAQVGANPVPPGTDPNNPAAAAGAQQPLNPADPNAAANNAQVQAICATPGSCQNPDGEAADQTAVSGMTKSEKGHLVLDGVGMAPVIGEVADVANGIWYFAEGDWANGFASIGSAVPGIGNAITAGKWASKAGKLAKLGDEAAEGAQVGKLPATTPPGREALAQAENPALKSCLNSFTATTLVLMADGTRKPIKDVDRGNKVLATDPVTGERGPREVVNLIRHGGMHTMVAVQLSGAGQIDATDRHPFWVASQRRWVDAIDLKPGDVVLSDRGDQIKVTNLKTTKQDLTAYNLTVAGLHTYYVGDKPVLVHNANCPDGRPEGSAKPERKGQLPPGQNYHPTPKLNDMRTTFGKGLERAQAKTPVQGGGGLRQRWKDRDGTIYEHDKQHGTVEKYDKSGRKHLGEFDAKTGEQTKGPDLTRRVEK